MPVYNRILLTISCIESIGRQSYSNYKIIICAHGPNDVYELLRKKYPNIVVLKGHEKMWWTAATNKCVQYVLDNGTTNDFVFTLNDDTELENNCFEILIKSINRFPGSIVGCVNLLFDDRNSIEPSAQKELILMGFRLYKGVNRWGDDISKYQCLTPVGALSGKGVLIPANIFHKVGLYSEQMLPHYHADTEFSIRASKAGYRLFLSYDAKLYSHYQETGLTSMSSKKLTLREFLYGFKSIKSTRHYSSIKNRAKLIYGNSYPFYLFIMIFTIVIGYFRRIILSYVKSLRRNPINL